MTQESLTEKLAHHLMRPIDQATRRRARLHLLDWLGCVAGALTTDVGGLPRKISGIPGYHASWLGNVLEMDDVHRSSILHPGPVVWGTIFGQLPGNVDEMLDAAIRGYEATIAIGSTFDDLHYSYWHNTASAGIFGAAVAASFSFEQNPSRDNIVDAMGLAGSVSGGFWQMRNEVTMAKQWHVFHAAETGWHVAEASLEGATGPRFILEGPQGLYAATCKNPKPMTFPDQWRIHEVSFKPWGACRHAHPTIDAALELKARLGSLDGDIDVETYADAITFCDRPDPETVLDAKFSIQHAVAVIAERGVPQLADFELDAIPPLADRRDRVTVAEASDITARYPEHYGARVTCNGETVELIDTLGDPERPLSKEGVINKARALIAWGGLPDKEADRAVDLALRGDDAAAIHKLLEDWLS